MPNLTGKTIGNRYRVDELIGRGGMAEVYRVWDTERMTPLAMKVLREDLALDKVFLRRFAREADTLAKLQHPNIVRFYGLEREGRLAYMLLDFVEGETLKHLIFDSEDPMSEGKVISLIKPILSALHYAHNRGLVHCDVKPGNIMLDKQGYPLLADFGIARVTESATATLVGIGTPAYMAPEQIKGHDPTAQTDIYAIGIVLYELITNGERPFTGEQANVTGSTSEKVRWEHLELKPKHPSQYNPQISKPMERVILKCLEKDPAKRFSNAMELLHALENPSVLLSEADEFENDQTIDDLRSDGNEFRGTGPMVGRPQKATKSPALIMGSVLVGLVFLIILFVAINPDDTPPTLTYRPQATKISTNIMKEMEPSEASEWTPSPKPRPTNTQAESSTWRPCPGSYATRLQVGDQAYVSYDPPLANNVRSAPDLDAKIVGQIQPGESISIIGGPACSNDWVWWKIKSRESDVEGWTSEGDGKDYWLVPD